jgi:hypothetical protein
VKSGEKLGKLNTLILIRNKGLKTFGNHRDLAENPFQSVWVGEK